MANSRLQVLDCRVGEVWRREDGLRVRIEGFTKIDHPPWVKVREVGGDRARGSYPPEAFRNGGFMKVTP